MAINLGLANDYNVFVFGNLTMGNTDAEGRVAVGGNATLSNYGVGAGIIPLPPVNTDPSFVVGGDVNVTAGSNACGNTVVNPASNVISYTMGNPNGQFIVGSPIDFAAAEQYLKCASAFWSTLVPNGTGEVIYGQLNLTGTDEILNVFTLDSGNLYGTGISLAQLNGITVEDYATAISYGGGQNFYLDGQWQKLQDEDYTTAFSLANAAKDVGICMELAKECGLEMPGEANVKKVYDKGMEAGMGGDDWRSTFKLVRGH